MQYIITEPNFLVEITSSSKRINNIDYLSVFFYHVLVLFQSKGVLITLKKAVLSIILLVEHRQI